MEPRAKAFAILFVFALPMSMFLGWFSYAEFSAGAPWNRKWTANYDALVVLDGVYGTEGRGCYISVPEMETGFQDNVWINCERWVEVK